MQINYMIIAIILMTDLRGIKIPKIIAQKLMDGNLINCLGNNNAKQ